jgi:hypothetical protein
MPQHLAWHQNQTCSRTACACLPRTIIWACRHTCACGRLLQRPPWNTAQVAQCLVSAVVTALLLRKCTAPAIGLTEPAISNLASEAELLCAGPRSSALVGGYTVQHAELELALARLKGAPADITCPSGCCHIPCPA